MARQRCSTDGRTGGRAAGQTDVRTELARADGQARGQSASFGLGPAADAPQVRWRTGILADGLALGGHFFSPSAPSRTCSCCFKRQLCPTWWREGVNTFMLHYYTITVGFREVVGLQYSLIVR